MHSLQPNLIVAIEFYIMFFVDFCKRMFVCVCAENAPWKC